MYRLLGHLLADIVKPRFVLGFFLGAVGAQVVHIAHMTTEFPGTDGPQRVGLQVADHYLDRFELSKGGDGAAEKGGQVLTRTARSGPAALAGTSFGRSPNRLRGRSARKRAACRTSSLADGLCGIRS